MYMIVEVSQYVAVASFSEAWIEIYMKKNHIRIAMSPPSRRRGLKSLYLKISVCDSSVASFSEAWIEICIGFSCVGFSNVASFSEAWIEITNFFLHTLSKCAGASFSEAWIEIDKLGVKRNTVGSPPSRRRGLKSQCTRIDRAKVFVASFSEAWIEI